MNKKVERELREALENLEVFVATGEPSLQIASEELEVRGGKIVPSQQGTLKKTIAFARAFLTPTFAEAKQEKLYRALMTSSELIKQHAVLLHLWEAGTDEQRHFVTYAKGAIEKFNALIENRGEEHSSGGRLFRFFYSKQEGARHRLVKIDVAPQVPLNVCLTTLSSTQYDPLKVLNKVVPKTGGADTSKVSELRVALLPVQAHEMFMMKAISLLEKNGIASHDEAREMVKNGKIETEQPDEAGIYVASLSLTPFPGRLIEIKGAFIGRIPLTDLFQISLRAL